MAIIKTPDQRVRVFISSTIQELAAERLVVKEAISRLRLIPVLFEMGARPHPPQELYRAYLAQSHIFVGIYWNSYGWVAPGMNISGLEDEYRLSEGKPRLIYVKQPAPERQEKLSALLNEIKSADTSCYQRFSTPEELRDLLENDLALLLSERFESDRSAVEINLANLPGSQLPVIRNPLIGRERELEEIRKCLLRPDTGLVTLTGTGGTGKTALSMQLAHSLKDHFKDGVFFVPLATVADPNLLGAAILQEIGVFDAGQMNSWDALANYLAGKKCLLVLDNFEQIVEAGPQLTELLGRCPQLTILVTSRTPLHLRGEQVRPISPLPLPEMTSQKDQVESYPSVQLFLERATHTNPSLPQDPESLRAIAEICKRLDGLPLAIELAAARTRFLSPTALLGRMTKVLDLLSKGPRDLPERQQTLRSTIDWSYNLLDEPCKRFFRRLGVFEGSWNLDAAEEVAAWSDNEQDILEITERLADLGLLRPLNDQTNEPRFSFLQTVREYAQEQLNHHQELQEAKKRHAQYFRDLIADAGQYFPTGQREPWLNLMESEFPNIRATFYYLLTTGDKAGAWDFFGDTGWFWSMRGYHSDAKKWIKDGDINASEDKEINPAIPPEVQAKALAASGMVGFNTGDIRQASRNLERSASIYGAKGMIMGRAQSLVFLGLANTSLGLPDAVRHLEEALFLSQDTNPAIFIIAATILAEGLASHQQQYEKAGKILDQAFQKGQESGDSGLLGIAALQKGNLAITLGNYGEAETHYLESLSLYPPKMLGSYRGWSLIGLAFCDMNKSHFSSSRKKLNTALDFARESGDLTVILGSLLGIAGCQFYHGKKAAAARLLGGADGLMHRTGYRTWSATTQLFNQVENLVQAEQDLIEERSRGKQMSLEELFAIAMN